MLIFLLFLLIFVFLIVFGPWIWLGDKLGWDVDTTIIVIYTVAFIGAVIGVIRRAGIKSALALVGVVVYSIAVIFLAPDIPTIILVIPIVIVGTFIALSMFYK